MLYIFSCSSTVFAAYIPLRSELKMEAATWYPFQPICLVNAITSDSFWVVWFLLFFHRKRAPYILCWTAEFQRRVSASCFVGWAQSEPPSSSVVTLILIVAGSSETWDKPIVNSLVRSFYSVTWERERSPAVRSTSPRLHVGLCGQWDWGRTSHYPQWLRNFSLLENSSCKTIVNEKKYSHQGTNSNIHWEKCGGVNFLIG